MSEYADDTRLEFVDLRDELVTDLQADGLIFAEIPVYLVTETVTDADEEAGLPGTVTPVPVELTPRPKVDPRIVRRWVNGAPVQVGTATLTFSRAAATEAELLGAAYFLVGASTVAAGGVKHRLVEGELKKTALDWVAVLDRMR